MDLISSKWELSSRSGENIFPIKPDSKILQPPKLYSEKKISPNGQKRSLSPSRPPYLKDKKMKLFRDFFNLSLSSPTKQLSDKDEKSRFTQDLLKYKVYSHTVDHNDVKNWLVDSRNYFHQESHKIFFPSSQKEDPSRSTQSSSGSNVREGANEKKIEILGTIQNKLEENSIKAASVMNNGEASKCDANEDLVKQDESNHSAKDYLAASTSGPLIQPPNNNVVPWESIPVDQMLQNEIYFPGWENQLLNLSPSTIEALEYVVNDSLKSTTEQNDNDNSANNESNMDDLPANRESVLTATSLLLEILNKCKDNGSMPDNAITAGIGIANLLKLVLNTVF